jgi:hypothetical protein
MGTVGKSMLNHASQFVFAICLSQFVLTLGSINGIAVLTFLRRKQNHERRVTSMQKVGRIFLVSLLLPLPLRAQHMGASETGHECDPSDAAVSGARTAVTSTTTGAVLTAESNHTGTYQFRSVTVGEYTRTVEKQGFTK